MPIAYSALQKGTPVVSASGTQFGVVEHVLEIPAEDLFDGIVVSTADGLCFVDRDQIDNITTTRVRCVLTDEQAQTLSPPTAPPCTKRTRCRTQVRRCTTGSAECSAVRAGTARIDCSRSTGVTATAKPTVILAVNAGRLSRRSL